MSTDKLQIESALQKIYNMPLERKHFNVKCIPGHTYYCVKCNQTQRTATTCASCNGFYLQSVCIVCKSPHQNIRNHYKENHYIFYCMIQTVVTRNTKYDNILSVINDFANLIKSDTDTVKELCYSLPPKGLLVNCNNDTLTRSTAQLSNNSFSVEKKESIIPFLTVVAPNSDVYTQLKQTQNELSELKQKLEYYKSVKNYSDNSTDFSNNEFLNLGISEHTNTEKDKLQSEIVSCFCVYCQCGIANFARDFVFLPCGHSCHTRCWTIDCSSSIESVDKKCPVCRTSVLTEDQMDLLPLVVNGKIVRSSKLLNNSNFNEPTIDNEFHDEDIDSSTDAIYVWSKPVRNLVSKTYSRKGRKLYKN